MDRYSWLVIGTVLLLAAITWLTLQYWPGDDDHFGSSNLGE